MSGSTVTACYTCWRKVADKWKALQAENIDSSWYEEKIVNNEGKSTKEMIRVDHF